MVNARKQKTPSGSDTTVSRATIFEAFGNSIRDVVPVANVTERAQLVAALTAAGEAPSTTAPLVVHRADAPGTERVEYTVDGLIFLPASGRLRFASKAAADSFGISNGALLSVNDRAMAAGVELTWTGTQWVGDWRSSSTGGSGPGGSGFEVFGPGIRFRRVGYTVFYDVFATRPSPWELDNWSVAPIPVDHRPATTISHVSIYGDTPKELQFTAAGSVVVAKKGSIGIAASGSYPVN